MIVKGEINESVHIVQYVANLFKDIGVVAGGSVVAASNNLPITGDVDVFLYNSVSLREVNTRLTKGGMLNILGNLPYSYNTFIHIPLLYEGTKRVKLNLLSRGDRNPTDVLHTFDLANCRVYWGTETQQIIGDLQLSRVGSPLRPTSMYSLAKSLERIDKYKEKGFRVDRATYRNLEVLTAGLYLSSRTNHDEILENLYNDYPKAEDVITLAEATDRMREHSREYRREQLALRDRRTPPF